MSRALPRPSLTVLPDVHHRAVTRPVHPWAWWLWAIGAAIAVSAASNPIALFWILGAVLFVVLQRRGDEPWARSLRFYLILGVWVVVIRLTFQVILGGLREGRVLFTLPEATLPDWAAGIRLGGPVTLEGVVYTGVTASQLAILIICIGAANSLANPRTALRSVPAAFYQLATALVIAISVAPQLIQAILRVRRAHRLRRNPAKGIKAIPLIVIPVLQDAIEDSMTLAASMESRGYGRTRAGRTVGAGDAALIICSVGLLIFGVFAILAVPASQRWPLVTVALAVVGLIWGIRRSGAYLAVTRYRPLPWAGPEYVISACGLVAGIVMVVLHANDPSMYFAAYPLRVPAFSWQILVPAVLVAFPGILPAPSEVRS